MLYKFPGHAHEKQPSVLWWAGSRPVPADSTTAREARSSAKRTDSTGTPREARTKAEVVENSLEQVAEGYISSLQLEGRLQTGR